MFVKAESKYNGESEKSLPLELWACIIVNLPVSTLLRFRCVCKSWCSIIDNPDFAYRNLKLRKIDSKKTKIIALERLGRFGEDGSLLTVRQGDALQEAVHIFKSFHRYYVTGRCNGLLLVMSNLYSSNNNKDTRLWNPSIRKSLLIPPCPLGNGSCLFGFAPLCKDYKIVAALCGEQTVDVAVYTLSDQKWNVNQKWNVRDNGRDISCSKMESILASCYDPTFAFYFQGAAHWIGQDLHMENQHQYYQQTYLVSFNFDSEKFTILENPRDWKQTARFLFLLGESLAIFSINPKRSRIWVREHHGSGKGVWTKWFSGCSTSDACTLFFYSFPCSLPVYYESDGQSYLIYGKKSYEIATGRVKELDKSMSSRLDLELYMESLVLWKGYGAEDMASFPNHE